MTSCCAGCSLAQQLTTRTEPGRIVLVTFGTKSSAEKEDLFASAEMTNKQIFGTISTSMFPDQQNQNGGQPVQPGQPPYQPPQYGVNSAPQQTANGQYQVVPPPSVTGRPTGHNPYEFIVNPNTQRKGTGLFGGNKFLQQIVVLVGGVVLLMVVLAIAVSVVAPKKDNGASLTAIAQRQQEIVRVATLGAGQAVNQSTRNFATSAELTVGSSQSQLINDLASTGTKLSAKLLALNHSAQTDKLLADASASNTFDSAITQNLTTQLTSYEGSLRTAFKQSSSTKTKQILQSSYNAAVLLLEQAKTSTN